MNKKSILLRGKKELDILYTLRDFVFDRLLTIPYTTQNLVMYYDSILELIGNTPMVRINSLNPNSEVPLLAKLEFLNPGGSVKDRIGIAMLDEAEKRGELKKGGTIVEPTSGNTGTGLALVACLRGYRSIFVIPDKMSEEKRNLLKAYGATVVLTPTAVNPEDERSYYKVSDRLVKEIRGGYKPDQYHNPVNPKIHYETTGPEIWEQSGGKITHFVCGIGTGGTITGVGRFLKEKNSRIRVVGVDPVGSVFYEYKRTGKIPELLTNYKVEGVGEDFLPSTADFSVIDEVIQVADRECFLTARKLARKEALLVGGSSGMAMFAAQKVCRRLRKGLVVVLFPDSGKSYLSKVFNDDWMRELGFLKHEKGSGDIIGDVIKGKKDKTLLAVGPNDTVKKAISIMKSHDISQMPVIKKKTLIGKVTERQLLTGLYKKRVGPTNRVSTVVDPNITSVSEYDSVDHVSGLLSQETMVVVVNEHGLPVGVVTRIDLIEHYT